MVKHLRPLYIKAYINGKIIRKVFVDGGAMLNIMPLGTEKRIRKSEVNLVPTNMRMTNFTGGDTNT